MEDMVVMVVVRLSTCHPIIPQYPCLKTKKRGWHTTIFPYNTHVTKVKGNKCGNVRGLQVQKVGTAGRAWGRW